MKFNYTEVYRDVYAKIKTDAIPHEEARIAALKIADALLSVYLFSKDNYPEISEVINNTMQGIQDKD
jgi:hypothetical protein